MSVPPSHTQSKNRLEPLSEGWGLGLYEPDPPIYDPWHDAVHRGKAPHNLMLKIYDYCHQMHWLPPGALVLDPFGGSGRTGIVGSIKGHPVALIEIEPFHARQTMPKNIAYAKDHTSSKLWSYDPIYREGDARDTKLPSDYVSAVITSPPYADQIDSGSNEATIRALGGRNGNEPSTLGTLQGYGKAPGQIGVLKVGVRSKKRESYEDAMETVYAEMYRVTRPGGILVTIIKDGIKEGKLLPLNKISRKLIHKAGWKLLEIKDVEVNVPVDDGPDLFGTPAEPRIVGHRVSYFRRFHYKRDRNSLIRYEQVCFFQKPLQPNGHTVCHPVNGNAYTALKTSGDWTNLPPRSNGIADASDSANRDEDPSPNQQTSEVGQNMLL